MDWNTIAGIVLTLATVVAGIYAYSRPKRIARKRRDY